MPAKPNRRFNNLAAKLHSIRTGPGAAVLPPHVTQLHLEFAHKGNNGHYGPRKFWREHLPSLKYHNPGVPMLVNRTRDQDIEPTLSIYIKSDAAFAALPKQLLLDVPSAPSEGGGGGGKKNDKNDKDGGSSSSSSSPFIQEPTNAVAIADPGMHAHSATDGSGIAPPPRDGETIVQMKLRNTFSRDIWADFVAKTGAVVIEPSQEDIDEMERLAAREAHAEYDRRMEAARMEEKREERAMLERSRQEVEALKE